MNSTIIRLVKYHNIFRQTLWLREEEAEAKLAREQELYNRWSKKYNRLVTPPRIER